MKDESSWVERFYTHYLGRDLAYLFAGGLFIGTVEYVRYGNLDYIPTEPSLKLVGFVLGSYFLGLTFRAFITASLPKLFDYMPQEKIKSCIRGKSPTELGISQYLSEKADYRVLNQRERFFYMLAIYLSIGTSSILSGISMVIGRYAFNRLTSFDHILLFVGSLFAVGCFMLRRAYYWLKKIYAEDSFLIDYFESENKYN